MVVQIINNKSEQNEQHEDDVTATKKYTIIEHDTN